MHKRIAIYRGKIEQSSLYDMAFSTGDNLKFILDTIKPYADNCTIFLHGCEKMVHFRATLSHKFPNAVIRHTQVELNTL